MRIKSIMLPTILILLAGNDTKGNIHHTVRLQFEFVNNTAGSFDPRRHYSSLILPI